MPTKVKIFKSGAPTPSGMGVPFSTLAEGDWFFPYSYSSSSIPVIGVKIGNKGFYPGKLSGGGFHGHGSQNMLVHPIKTVVIKQHCSG
jgi:hypothetical protein